ncbi:hypothetical protein [Williamsia sp. M5A3_1d]
MTKCPRCFAWIHPDTYKWMCQSGRCETAPDPIATAFTGGPVSSGPLLSLERASVHRDFWPPQAEAAQCPECEVTAPEVCSVCHYVYPAGWRSAQATCIAMAGARATGKSFFVAVGIQQLETALERLGASLEPATTATQETFRKVYVEPLYEKRGLLAVTRKAEVEGSHQREPLIFRIGVWGGVTRYLVMRDVAGEDLEDVEAGGTNFGFFAHADAVFFMFDPLKSQEIRDQLQDLIPSQQRLGGDPKTVLNNLSRQIASGRPKVAVILSKFDALQALERVEGSEWGQVMSNPGAAFHREPVQTQQYDDNDGLLLHHETRSLLMKLHAGPIVAAVESRSGGVDSPNHRFFAVSALGDSPVGELVNAKGIAPFRCTDPIRWVLAGNGVL